MAKNKKEDIVTPEGATMNRVLSLPLSDAEKAKRADLLAEMQIELVSVEDTKKNAAAGFNAKIKEARKAINNLSRQVRDGLEEKNVECTVVMNYEANEVEYWFEGKVVEKRDMVPEDRQQDLALETPIKKGRGKKQKAEDEEVFESREEEVRDVIKMETSRKTKRTPLDGAHPG